MKKILIFLGKIYIKFMTYLFRVFPIDNSKIIFCNFFGKGYGCNSKYICEYILQNNLDYKLFWIVKSNSYKFPTGVTPLKLYSIKYFYHLATAKFFFDNQHKNSSFLKRKKQVFIKTWHATIGLKKIGMDNKQNGKDHVRLLDYNNRIVDLMLSNCDYIEEKFRRVFRYKGNFLRCGFPRTDILVENSLAKRVDLKKKLNLPVEKKIVLYAPTFRDNLSTEYFTVDYKKLIETLNEKFSSDFIVLIKLHPHMINAKIDLEDTRIINFSSYEDIQELLLISDILITDYSNIMFEFALKKEPVFLYASDYEEYKESRDFYFSIQELPFPIAKSNEELFNKISSFNNLQYLSNLDNFYSKINFIEYKNSSEQIVNYLDSKRFNKH